MPVLIESGTLSISLFFTGPKKEVLGGEGFKDTSYAESDRKNQISSQDEVQCEAFFSRREKKKEKK